MIKKITQLILEDSGHIAGTMDSLSRDCQTDLVQNSICSWKHYKTSRTLKSIDFIVPQVLERLYPIQPLYIQIADDCTQWKAIYKNIYVNFINGTIPR